VRDQRLAAAVRAGDKEAFADVYDRHAAELRSYCRRALQSQDDAEDALQQTFFNAYRALRECEGEVSIRPWLYRIAHNECISLIRRRRAGERLAPHATGAGVATEVEDREELNAALSDLARLPDEQQQALILSGLERLSGSEIAEELGTDRDRVKALVYRARQSMSRSREARELECGDIRAQLRVLRGGSLRRKVLSEHLARCDDCRDYREEIVRVRHLGASEETVPTPRERPTKLTERPRKVNSPDRG